MELSPAMRGFFVVDMGSLRQKSIFHPLDLTTMDADLSGNNGPLIDGF